MTLVIGVTGRKTIWMCADRRLTLGTKTHRDDACKLFQLEGTNGKAILGYAGLGETLSGTQPSDWMARVFRGVSGTLDELLTYLFEVMKEELPRHLPSSFLHVVIANSLVDGKPVVASLSLQGQKASRHSPVGPHGKVPRIVATGSGTGHLQNREDWARPILRLVAAAEAHKISIEAVSDEIARLTYELSKSDPMVGPRSMVLWTDQAGTGSHTFYSNGNRDSATGPVPTIARGMDINALLEIALKHAAPDGWESVRDHGFAEIDKDRINADLAHLPSVPDRKLK